MQTQDFAATAEHLRQSTVHVRSGRMGSGSGVIWRPDGLIVTNAHVARGTRAGVEFADGRELEAEVIGRDAGRDLAALRVPASNLPAVSVGDSDALRVGQLVIAVGNPLGLSGALTVGIVHAIGPAESQGRQTWVQADVRLAPGNSGGPLADVAGRVIGINSMVAGGLGLAVPTSAVTRFLGYGADRPRLGVTTQPVLVQAGRERVPGLLVLETEPGSAAATHGILVGDVLLGSQGRSLSGSNELGNLLADAGFGSAIQFDMLRGGQPFSLLVRLPVERETTKEAA